MKVNLVFVFSAAITATACVSVNMSDTCRYASQPPLHQYNPEALTFVLGYPSRQALEAPFLVLGRPSADQSELKVELAALDGRFVQPHEFNKHRCKNVNFHAFTLEVETENWESYWTSARQRGNFSMGVAFPGLDVPVRSRSIGFALVDNSTQKFAAACGCLTQ